MLMHKVIPFSDQTNPGVDRNDPTAAVTAIELRFPDTFSNRAWKVIKYFEGTMFLYTYKGKFIATDESLELTDYGDGTHEAPLGGPRWVGDTLDDLEQWLLKIADEFDADADEIPGWEVEAVCASTPKKAWQNPLANVMVKLVRSSYFISMKTYCRTYGSHGRFLMNPSTLEQLVNAKIGKVGYEWDCGNYCQIIRQKDSLQFSISWLNADRDGSLEGFRQDLMIPLQTIRRLLEWKESEKVLCVPPVKIATIDISHAYTTIHNVVQDKKLKRALSKAMRDRFHWPGDRITLYSDSKFSFYFTTESGFPKNGGLILHEGMKNGHPYVYYSVHT